ncbi:hypothetical protein C0Q70_04516 [Pomacea canaliculata]|uniref:ADAMTS cysteine-rich domain-containing protein n=1 Tax=Pomacea canaliculata TaxID=400727 RepID=A0A2T7PIL1_POMCA|nr:hypothetical protein C0Q70_04516 [Pomacea canaliculata]
MRAMKVSGVERLLTPPATAPPARGQHTGRQDVYIDIAAVADYGVYSNWYSASSEITEELKALDVLDKLPEYYALVFSGVNMMYQGISTTSSRYNIHVRLSTLIVATEPGDSEWTESVRVTDYPYDHVDADDALSSFSQCRVILFASCSLSANHDGDDNSCSQDDENIMAATYSPLNVTDRHSLWRFSHCSVNYFNDFLRQTMSTTRGHQCLYNTLTPDTIVPDVSGQQPGQVYDYDAQCRQVYGPQSRMCRGLVSSPSDICMKLYCDSLTDDLCYPRVAARGTSCGDKKWCVNGDCVYDSQAPAMEEDCPFGDLPGLAWNSNQTCSELIASNPGNCYDDNISSYCCASCAKYYTPLENCNYGDKVPGCTTSDCDDQLDECCGTCLLGTPDTIQTSTPVSSSTTRTPRIPWVWAHHVCMDTPDGVLGKACSDIVGASTGSCYNSYINSSCCASCRSLYTGVKGCEFGDRDPALCRFAPVGDCEVELKEACCQTCAQATPRPSTLNRAPYHMVYSTASQWPPPVTPSLIGWMHVLAWVAYWPVTRFS